MIFTTFDFWLVAGCFFALGVSVGVALIVILEDEQKKRKRRKK